jgi:dTDP-glucose pyrophosphorylase
MTKKSEVTAIIPCCGYGTRMNMPVNKSKELLINPDTNKPLIEWHLDQCKEYNIKPLCIVRQEKLDLMLYLLNKDIDFIVYTPKPNEEWMHTIYNNKQYYNEMKNILLLPDTIYEPKEALKEIKDLLDIYDFVFGTHEVKDPEKWGLVNLNSLLEKPKNPSHNRAWGILGFNDVEIFKQLGYNKEIDLSLRLIQFVDLDLFKDLTRNEKERNDKNLKKGNETI